MDNKTRLELELFLFGLIAQAEKSFRRLSLNADEMYVLVYIKSFGKTLGSNRMVLRSDLTSIMKKAFDRKDSAISKCLNVLLEEGFLSARHLAVSERMKLYGTAAGRKTAMVLTERGLRKAQAFSKEVDRLWLSCTSNQLPDLIGETFEEIFAQSNRAGSLARARSGFKGKR